MGARPSRNHSLDRIDPEGNYEPGNCRWATRSEQNRNKRNHFKLSFEGRTLTVAGWAEETGLTPGCIRNRLRKGRSIVETLEPSHLSRGAKGPRSSYMKRGAKKGFEMEHRAWYQLLKRCTDLNHFAYANHGGRGVRVCPEWSDPGTGFQQFLTDMGPRPDSKHSLRRIDPDGDFKASNCHWAVSAGRSRKSHVVTYQGESRSLSEWSRLVGLPIDTIRGRLKLEWPIGEVLGFEPHTRRG